MANQNQKAGPSKARRSEQQRQANQAVRRDRREAKSNHRVAKADDATAAIRQVEITAIGQSMPVANRDSRGPNNDFGEANASSRESYRRARRGNTADRELKRDFSAE